MTSTDQTEEKRYQYNFTKNPKAGYTSVIYDEKAGVPIYNDSIGYGFVQATCAQPPREVHTAEITSDGAGFVITEPYFYAKQGCEADHYNHYGMAFRIQAPPGAYEIHVKTTSDAADTTVSVSGMQGTRIVKDGFWDAAELVPIRTVAAAAGKEWSFSYANGRQFIDIEIEPNQTNVPVGIEEIVLKPIGPRVRSKGSLPTIFTLGDSTVKSYVFAEAPMNGWGQVFDNMFDLNRVHVMNYSMGGRSFKNSDAEGRLNDILMTGHAGDFLLIQFGHNDERMDEDHRYGRGSTEAMYEAYIRDLYIPAVRARGIIPVLVTPMSRVEGNAKKGDLYTNSFKARRFPDIMKALGRELDVTVLDLNTESVNYYNEIGVEATTSIFMAIEAGETPGKTNDGSYANGHPSRKNDGTHYKEALSKQLARIVVTELMRMGTQGNPVAASIASYLKQDVKEAIASGNWSDIFPEMAKDTTTGPGSYYRNQIEKLLQLGVMKKDSNDNFNPDTHMNVEEFSKALCMLMQLDAALFAEYRDGELSREIMAAILHDAYQAKFSSRPKYMTDYNGSTTVPGDPDYDPNLDAGAKGVMYYPIAAYEQLTDTMDIAPDLAAKVRAAYDLGLARSEKGIVRGQMVNGTEFEPKKIVTRAKAAKALYYMWVLVHPVHIENDVSTLH